MRKCIQIMNFQFRQIRLKSNWEIRKMGKYFGTDGFRGEANVVLTVEHAFILFRTTFSINWVQNC